MTVNYIDILIAVPLLWGLYKGFSKGFIFEMSSLVALGLGIWAGTHFSDFCAEKIVEYFDWQSPYLPIVSFAIVFIGIVVAISIVARILKRLVKELALGGIDKLLGAVVGSLKYALIISVIIFVINAIESSYPLISFEAKNESVLYEPVGQIATIIIPALNDQGLLP